MDQMTYPKAREEEMEEKPWPRQFSDYMSHGWKKKSREGIVITWNIEEVRRASVKQY